MQRVENVFKKVYGTAESFSDKTADFTQIIADKIVESVLFIMTMVWIYISIVPLLVVILIIRLIGLVLAVLLFPLASIGLAGWVPLWLLVEITYYMKRMDCLKLYYTSFLSKVLFTPVIWIALMIFSPIDSFIIMAEKYCQSKRKEQYSPTSKMKTITTLTIRASSLSTLIYLLKYGMQVAKNYYPKLVEYATFYGLEEIMTRPSIISFIKSYHFYVLFVILILHMLAVRTAVALLNDTHGRVLVKIGGDDSIKLPSDYLYDFFSWSYKLLVMRVWPSIMSLFWRFFTILCRRAFQFITLLSNLVTKACITYFKLGKNAEHISDPNRAV